MSDAVGAVVVAGGLGQVMPFLVERIKRAHWPAWVSLTVTLGLCVLAGAWSAIAGGQIRPGMSWVTAAGIVFASSQLAYRTWAAPPPPEPPTGPARKVP